VLDFFPHHDVSFDGNWFLRVLVPPIIFEAALSIDKRSFNRHIVPILIYAIAGTLMATVLTAFIVHYGTAALPCSTIPYVEALTFGSLISSIDPIAVLSVLSNMGMNDTDTIYVLIFGESLLNDGVAIVLFHTLVHFLDETLIIDREAVIAATVHFFVVAFGSLFVGLASGMLSTVYYWIFYGCQTPLVEVLMFFCWALLPYYVCDGIGWSGRCITYRLFHVLHSVFLTVFCLIAGIVAAVAVGFVMDLHIVGAKNRSNVEDVNVIDLSETSAASHDSNGESKLKSADRGRRRIFNQNGHLSNEARTHIGFVTEIIATGMEMAIFAYLGFFLFSHRYHWNFFHMLIAVMACCISRAMMIPTLSFVANRLTRIQQNRAACRQQQPIAMRRKEYTPAGVIVDKKMQIVLWMAGLRGGMSMALVEHIPLYDSFSGEGTRMKPELKAMTSASILFTVFVLGGYTYYMMERLGIAPSNNKINSANAYELSSLLAKGHETLSGEEDEEDDCLYGPSVPIPGKARAFRRPRTTQGEPIQTI
jgi:NhaP-type Na+/H+ or K+/H+ antiporter